MSVYFFYGDEDYNIEQEINKLKNKLLDKNFASMNFKVADNPSFADLISLLRTQPMMFGNMMIVIDCNDYFSGSFEDSQLKEITDALEGNPETLCIVFRAILPRNEGKKVDSRKKIYKIITKYAQCQEFPTFRTYKQEEIASWIKKEAKKQEISLEEDAIITLIEQVGNNLRELVKELEKLKLLAYPKTVVTKKMVKEISISNEDLFSLTDFLIKNDKGHALIEFHKLLDKKHPLEILSSLQTMMRRWIIIKSKAREKSPLEISRLVGQHEFVVKKTMAQMKDTSLRDLINLKQNLTDAEYKIKSGKAIDAVEELECALFKGELNC